MKLCMAVLLLAPALRLSAQENSSETYQSPGMFSIGTRNTFSMFNDDNAMGKGIGGQVRVQLGKHIGSEWFFDYITSKNGNITYRNDYHIGWSLMYYPVKAEKGEKLLQPYFVAGHCFDYSKVTEQGNKSNYADRWSMATQAGIGTHINITSRFDCSLSAQYMMHFGKEIETNIEKENVIIAKQDNTAPDGHLLVSLSFNYKLFHLFN
jgi:hypothetical protein